MAGKVESSARKAKRPIPLVAEVAALNAVLATVMASLVVALLSALPDPHYGSLTKAPTAADVLRTAILLCAITFATCAPFGFVSGVAGGAWLLIRRPKLRSIKRLLWESAIVGFLLGGLYNVQDRFLNFLQYHTAATSLSILQAAACFVCGAVCAMICALIFRKHLVQPKS